MSVAGRALWIPVASNPPEGDQRERIIQSLLRKGFRSLVVQIVRHGSSWRLESKSSDAFELTGLLNSASEYGLEVHGWINCFYLGEWNGSKPGMLNYYPLRIVDQEGEDDPSTFDTPGFWSDPTDSRLQRALLEQIRTLVENFPSLRGIHLDYIRYPYCLPIRPSSAVRVGHDLGYSPTAFKLFDQYADACGTDLFIRGKIGWVPKDYDTAICWDNFRRSTVTNFVTKVREIMPKDMQLSAAVLPWIDRAYLSAFQDWGSWLEQDIVDWVAPMLYTRDNTHFQSMLRTYRFCTERIRPGIGHYLMHSWSDAELQETEALRYHSETCWFSWESIQGQLIS